MAAFVPRNALAARGIRSAGMFPSVGLEVFNILLHLVGVTVVSAMLARKLKWILDCPTWPRILVLINHSAAWAFFFTISILVDSVGMEISETVCLLGVFVCLSFYACTKFTIYLFLAEKVYAVWSVGPTRGRLHCKTYLASMVFIISYSGALVMLILERIAYFRDGLCIIGETRISSSVHLGYDSFVNVFLTLLFVWPLLTNKLTQDLRRVAIRSLWASACALVGSGINVGILAAMNGRELGWICLAGCGFDVIVNAGAMYWITAGNCDLTRPCKTEDESITVIDTLTANGVLCTNASDLLLETSASHPGPRGPAHNRLWYLSTMSSDVGWGHSAHGTSAGLPPGFLPLQDQQLYECSTERPDPLLADSCGGVCAEGDGRVVDVEAARRPQTRSLPSLGRDSGLAFPWCAGRATSTVPDQRRRTTLEIMVTKQTTVTNESGDDCEEKDPSVGELELDTVPSR